MDNEDVINPEATEFQELDEEQASATYERNRFAEAVVSASDWTTETIISQLKKENIGLTPRFQRRDAWTCTRKSKFIESLIIGLPIPQIVLAEKKKERGKYIVLDGKQRLLSLLQFVGAAKGSKNNAFKLIGLEVERDLLEGKTFQELNSNPELSSELNSFQNQTIRCVVIRSWPDLAFLHLVFHRLNTGSVKLSPQELRQALFPGDFSDLVDECAISSAALKELLKIDEPDFRMRDVELLVRYLAFRNFLTEYQGDMKKFLDDACGKLNTEWGEQTKANIIAQIDEFESGVKTAITIFGKEDVARRPKKIGGRRAFNRAIFDALIFYFSQKEVRDAAHQSPDSVIDAFYELWSKDGDFVKSVETTTKSIPAVYTRLRAWGAMLKTVLNIDIKVPAFSTETNRIVF